MARKYIPVAPPVGDADASEVLDGSTFSGENAGINVTGTMPNNGSGDITGPNDTLAGSGYYSSISNSIPDRGSLTVNPQASSQSFAAGYYDTVDVNGDGNLTPSNVRDGVTIFGTTGSLNPTYTTDIQVEGVQEGSFTQQSDSTYNVDIDGEPITKGQFTGVNDIYEETFDDIGYTHDIRTISTPQVGNIPMDRFEIVIRIEVTSFEGFNPATADWEIVRDHSGGTETLLSRTHVTDGNKQVVDVTLTRSNASDVGGTYQLEPDNDGTQFQSNVDWDGRVGVRAFPATRVNNVSQS